MSAITITGHNVDQYPQMEPWLRRHGHRMDQVARVEVGQDATIVVYHGERKHLVGHCDGTAHYDGCECGRDDVEVCVQETTVRRPGWMQ